MPILINKPYLPDQKKLNKYIDTIYQNHHLTNFGPLSIRLEERLREFLGVENLLLVNNGTTALELAYIALGLNGSALTSAFSFLATTTSLKNRNLKPVFIDIKQDSLNIDPKKLEDFLSANRGDISAIVPVHTYGSICEIEAIGQIAKNHNLKLIYDAAHCFYVDTTSGTSILNYGDISTLSLHATKLYHSIEGGAMVFQNIDHLNFIKDFINFGIRKDGSFLPSGTNCKFSEFNAAMGLAVLDDFPLILEKREQITNSYNKILKPYFQTQFINAKPNYHYYPIICKDEAELLAIKSALEAEEIYPRRYFCPSLNTIYKSEIRTDCAISENIASKILCLPIYFDLEIAIVEKIAKIITNTIKGRK